MDANAQDDRERRATIVFYLIAFGVPWVCWTILALGGGERDSTLRWALFFSGDACSVAGVVATGIAGGRAALRDLLRRAIRARASLAVWLIALVLPFVWRAITVPVSASGFDFVPGGFATVASWPVLFLFLTGPLGEELGWRGFLLPRLLRKHEPLKASLLLGLIWAVWHAPLYAPRWMEEPWHPFTFTAAVLAFSLLITAVHERSGQSVLLCILAHWAINASEPVMAAVLPSMNRFGDATNAVLELATLWLLVAAVWWATMRRRPAVA